MMVLGPKHVGAFLMFQCVNFINSYKCSGWCNNWVITWHNWAMASLPDRRVPVNLKAPPPPTVSSASCQGTSPRMRNIMTTSSTYWSRVWENINQHLLQDDWPSKRYRITRDIVSTQIRHHKIHLQSSDIRLPCIQMDTLICRRISCGETALVWQLMRMRAEFMSETELSIHSSSLTGFSKLLFSALVQTECCTLALIPYGTLRRQ